MCELTWLVGYSFDSLIRREGDWLIVFDRGASLIVECLWRLLENGRIRLTSMDQGQQFGLPAPIDASAEVNSRLARALVEAVELQDGTMDLELRFNTGHILQIIPTSSGYEAWTLLHAYSLYIAVGGGELSIFRGKAP